MNRKKKTQDGAILGQMRGMVIHDDTVKQASLPQNFRNLIHPGRAQRMKVKCDRGTALSALAAVEFIVRDLTP